MGKMPGGDALLLALIAVGSIWWLGVQYGAAGIKRVEVVRETVREVVREVQREAPKSYGATANYGPMAMTGAMLSYVPMMSSSYISVITGSVFYGVPYRAQTPCRGVSYGSLYEGPQRGLNQEMPCPP